MQNFVAFGMQRLFPLRQPGAQIGNFGVLCAPHLRYLVVLLLKRRVQTAFKLSRLSGQGAFGLKLDLTQSLP